MKWSEILEDKTLEDLPYKIEQDQWGNIVMSPASNKHGFIRTLLSMMLGQHSESGIAFVECSIQTSKGVKVADVIWASRQFFQNNGLETPYRSAPEICIEIRSPSNSMAELKEKKELYFARGAREVWICDESGQIHFYNHISAIERSTIFATFPCDISDKIEDAGGHAPSI